MAAVTPLGGQIYVNQASTLVSQQHQIVAQRFDIQSFVAMQMEREKEPKIEPVSEADGSGGIKADSEGSGGGAEYEGKKREQEENEEPQTAPASNHILDLKV